ncbi:MAG: hypothetical protein HOK33_06750 [Rhodobiaceae bacterium]|jgi:hypothetical protein|nr:hypothetical protein [Rhodobiaceae bacterium]MBT7279439.1 hypothetical protein [Rhodobiaceae bacterium]
MLFRVIIVLFAMTGFARAQAVWADYAWAVEPAKEDRFFAAVDKFTNSDAFSTFEGRMLVNAQIANGEQPQNFSFAVIYEDLATFEATQAQLNGNADWDRFRKALAANGTLVSETVYTHVKGWGEINNERFAWEGAAARVTDPANYIARLGRLMDSNIMADAPVSIDVWRVTAGGAPGVSHIVVFGSDSWSEMENFRSESAKNPDFVAAIAGMGKVRTMLGASWTRTAASYGPLDLNSLR